MSIPTTAADTNTPGKTNTPSRAIASGGCRRRLGAVTIALGSMFFAACAADETASSGTDTAPLPSEVITPATEAPVLTEPSATTATTAPPTTMPPATMPPATDPPAPNPPPSIDPSPTDAAPVFESFTASNVSACAAPDVSVPTIQRMVTLAWDISDAESVYVAIDNVNGPFEQGLPAVGSLQLPVSCPDDSTFYVVADNAAGRTVMEATR